MKKLKVDSPQIILEEIIDDPKEERSDLDEKRQIEVMFVGLDRFNTAQYFGHNFQL